MMFSGDRRIEKMNVSPEADAAFMRTLAQEDPERYRALMHNMHLIVDESGRGGRPRRFASNSARQRAYRRRQRSRALRNPSENG